MVHVFDMQSELNICKLQYSFKNMIYFYTHFIDILWIIGIKIFE